MIGCILGPFKDLEKACGWKKEKALQHHSTFWCLRGEWEVNIGTIIGGISGKCIGQLMGIHSHCPTSTSRSLGLVVYFEF